MNPSPPTPTGRGRAPSRSFRARAAAVVAAVVVVALTTGSAMAAAAPGTTQPPGTAVPGGSPAGASGRGSPTTTNGPSASARTGPRPSATSNRLALRGQTAVVAPTDTFVLQLGIEDAPDDATLSFEVRHPITNDNDARQALDAYAGGAGSNQAFQEKTGIPLSFVPTDATGNRVVSLDIVPDGVEAPKLGFSIADAGVYPVVVSLHGGDPSAELGRFTTFLVLLPGPDRPNAAPPLRLATVVPFRAPLALDRTGTVHIDDETQRRLQAVATTTRVHPSVPLTIDANPETVVALGDLGAGAPAGTTPKDLADAWQNDIVRAPTYVPIDATAWANAGLDDRLQQQLDLGGTSLTDRLHPARPLDTGTWIAGDRPSAAALAMLRDHSRSHVVVPTDAVEPLDPKALKPEVAQLAETSTFSLDLGTGSPVPAVVADDRLAGRLTETDNPVLNAQLAMADLAVTYFGAQRKIGPTAAPMPTRSIAVLAPEDQTGLAALDAFLTALATTPNPDGGGKPIVTPVALESLFDTPAPSPLVRAYRPPAVADRSTMASYPQQLRDAEQAIAGYRSMVQPSQPTRPGALERLLDVSGDRSLSPEQRQGYVDEVTATVHRAVEGIEPHQQERVTLAATEADLHIQVENRNDYPMAVRVTMSSDKLVFPNGKSFDSTLQPGTNRLDVRVETHSAGEFPLAIALKSPDDRIDIAATSVPVRSTAVSGVGTVLTVGAGIFLLVWWGRNLRKTRRADKLVRLDAGDEPDDPDTPDEDDESGSGPPSEPGGDTEADHGAGDPAAVGAGGEAAPEDAIG